MSAIAGCSAAVAVAAAADAAATVYQREHCLCSFLLTLSIVRHPYATEWMPAEMEDGSFHIEDGRGFRVGNLK